MTTFCPECGKQINDANGCRWCNITKKSMPNSDFINNVLKNPCEGCPSSSKVGDNPYYCEKDGCTRYGEYEIRLNQTKVVLEWLRANPDKYTWTEEDKLDCITTRTLQSLLKQLEEMER